MHISQWYWCNFLFSGIKRPHILYNVIYFTIYEAACQLNADFVKIRSYLNEYCSLRRSLNMVFDHKSSGTACYSQFSGIKWQGMHLVVILFLISWHLQHFSLLFISATSRQGFWPKYQFYRLLISIFGHNTTCSAYECDWLYYIYIVLSLLGLLCDNRTMFWWTLFTSATSILGFWPK